MKTNAMQEVQDQLRAKYPAMLVCELPDHEMTMGGLVHRLTTGTGHHSGRATIGGLNLWNVPANNLLSYLR